MTFRTPLPPDPLEHGCGPRAVRSLLGALQVGIVDARQLGGRKQGLWCAPNLIKSAQLALGLPSKPIPNLPRPEAIRRSSSSSLENECAELTKSRFRSILTH
jgi:hypothetical protein